MAVIIRTNAIMTGPDVGDPYLFSQFWLPGTPGGSSADASDALDLFSSMWTGLGNVMSSGQTINFDTVCLAYNDATGSLVGAFNGTLPSPVTTSGGTTPLPHQTQGLIAWGTAGVVSGRRVLGRTFVPLPDESENTTAGAPSGSYIANVLASAGFLLAVGATATEAVVWHRPKNGAGGSSHPITTPQARSSWSVLRTRR